MNGRDLTIKLATDKIEQLTGLTVEVEDIGYKMRVSTFNNTTYIRKEIATVSNKRELILLLSGMIEGAENGKAGF